MISYLLHIPKEPWERPEHPRHPVLVRLPSEDRQTPATLHFSGAAPDCERVRTALLRWAQGQRAAPIERNTTPAHLAVAMDGPVMQVFEPEELLGIAALGSPAAARAQAGERLALVTTELLAETLPRLPSFDDQARARLIEHLRHILVLCDSLCATPGEPCPPDAGEALAARVRDHLEAAGVDAQRLAQLLAEGCDFLALIRLDLPQTPGQVAAMLRRLVQAVSLPAQTDLGRLCSELRAIWTPGEI